MEEIYKLTSHLQALKFLVRCGGMSLESKTRKFTVKLKDRSVYVMNFFWLNCDVLGGIYWFIDSVSEGHNIVGATYIAPCITLSCMANFKGYFLVRHEDNVNGIMDDLKELEIKTSSKSLNEEEVAILRDETKFLKVVIKMSNILNSILLITFAVSPIILIVYKYMKTGEVELILPFLVVYPFDSHDIRFWPFVYAHQIWSECIVVINLCATDYLFYICCTFIRIQFRLLQYSLEHVLDDKNCSLGRTQVKLVELIKWHQKLIRLADTLEVVYTDSTLYNFLSSSIIICLTGFNVLVIDDVAFAVTFLVFLSSSMFQIYLLCFFGDMLMRSSTEVCDAVYKSKWYEANTVISKDLLLVQIRAQKPCRLTASGFADVNLRAFMRILSSAWSYFALLNTMYSSPRT